MRDLAQKIDRLNAHGRWADVDDALEATMSPEERERYRKMDRVLMWVVVAALLAGIAWWALP